MHCTSDASDASDAMMIMMMMMEEALTGGLLSAGHGVGCVLCVDEDELRLWSGAVWWMREGGGRAGEVNK